MNRRAQVGAEALIAIGVVLLLLMATYAIYSSKQSQISRSNIALAEYNDCVTISDAVTNAFLLGEGGVITARIDHALMVWPAEQRIESFNSFCTIPINHVLLNASPGISLSPGLVEIRHESVGVVIENA